MKIERRILKSISEFSMFKVFLVCYIIFFILSVIISAIAALLWWAVLSSSGITAQEALNSFMPGMNIGNILGLMGVGAQGNVLGIVIFIIVGLIASIFIAAIAALATWVFNVVLKITGGIEIRFLADTAGNRTRNHEEVSYTDK